MNSFKIVAIHINARPSADIKQDLKRKEEFVVRHRKETLTIQSVPLMLRGAGIRPNVLTSSQSVRKIIIIKYPTPHLRYYLFPIAILRISPVGGGKVGGGKVEISFESDEKRSVFAGREVSRLRLLVWNSGTVLSSLLTCFSGL